MAVIGYEILLRIWVILHILLRHLGHWGSHRLETSFLRWRLARIPSGSVWEERLLRYLHSLKRVLQMGIGILLNGCVKRIVSLRIRLIRYRRCKVSCRLAVRRLATLIHLLSLVGDACW